MKKQLMYLGERIGHFGKIHQVFKDKRGKTYTWNGIRGVWFGSVYEAENKKGGQLTMSTRPDEVSTDWRHREQERIEYDAAKLAVAGQRQRNLGAMKLRAPPRDIMNAVACVRRYYLALSDNERRRLIDWFANECSKKGRKK